MKCPFCFNEMIFVEVDTDDCIRECLECTNCGLRTPGAEIGKKCSNRRVMDKQLQEDALVFAWYADMVDCLQPHWNPKGE